MSRLREDDGVTHPPRWGECGEEVLRLHGFAALRGNCRDLIGGLIMVVENVAKGPKFTKFFQPVIDALLELGGGKTR